ncbi:allatostatin-A receptor isoform X2 [Plodia interpunctella]|uniref:allatostatin-A receptor isoform X2 n=1 Tax=Plodia interpunctella TaxID=58824 RepID=UPI002367B881|nr:allatostatin-A receptor isoform X2 [Plodia interpunctella]
MDEEDLINIDTSEYEFPNTLWHIKPAKEIAIKTSAMLFIGVSGIFMNSIILIVLIRNKWLWGASHYLIGNLALIDLLTLIFCPWFMLVRDFYQQYVLKNFGCQFEGFLQATLLLAGVGAVMLVSYDRLAAAALSADARVTRSTAPKAIFCTWFVAIVLSLPWILRREYTERQWLDYLETFCVEDVQVLGIYWHFTLTLLVWIPLGLMVITYGTIMWRLECSARELSSRGTGQAITKARSRALRITACVLMTAVVCRLPYTVLIYWRNNLSNNINSVEGSYDSMWFVANYLMYLNCAVNPLIYGFTNTKLRKAMDRTPGIACCKFGSWCCVCTVLHRKHIVNEDKHTDKIFVIEGTPRPNKKLSNVIKNILHINKETLDFSIKNDDVTTKPTKVTPVNACTGP